jgi:hypothetical protein
MADATCTVSNYWKYAVLEWIRYHTYKAVLMKPGFTFDKDNHKLYSDITAYEVAAGYGYITGGIDMVASSAVQDDINDMGILSFDNVTFIPSGADVSLCGVIIVDVSGGNVIFGFASAGGTVVASDGIGYVMRNIKARMI